MYNTTLNLIRGALPNVKKRKIVIWGAGKGAQETINMLASEGLGDRFAFIVDSKVQSPSVKNIDVLNCKGKYYVVVSISGYHPEIEDQLMRWGYEPELDYCYYYKRYVEGISDYSDKLGNRVDGNPGKAEICFVGRDARVKIGTGFLCSNLKILMETGASLEIGENVRIFNETSNDCARWKLKEGSVMILRNNVSLQSKGLIYCASHGGVYIDDGTTILSNHRIVASSKGRVAIGKDCLISHDFAAYSNDMHPIFSVESGMRLNNNCRKSNIDIGDHVWVGFRTTFLKNACVGVGSIIGSNSLVSKSYPNNCIAAGIPAKVLRENAAWSKEEIDSIEMIDREYIGYTEIPTDFPIAE